VTFVTVIFSRVPFQQTQAEEQIGLFGDRHAVRVSVLLDNRLVRACFFSLLYVLFFFFFASQLHVFGLHLDVYDEAGTARLKQAQQVISKIGTLENVVIAGDLNSLRRRDYCTADWEKIV
jgi:hypothetical protein